MLDRLLPKQAGNGFGGLRAALWLLGLLIFLKLVMSLNSIFNTRSVAVGADGIPLDGYGPAAAREVLLLFALMALGHLVITLIALVALYPIPGAGPVHLSGAARRAYRPPRHRAELCQLRARSSPTSPGT